MYISSIGIVLSLYYVFFSLSIEILETCYDIDPERAKNLISLMNLETIITTPLFGILVQKIGRKPLFLIMSQILLILSLTIFIFLKEDSFKIEIAIFLFAQFFCLHNVAMYPMVSLSVPSRSVGLALSIYSLVYSLSYSLISYISGIIVQSYEREDFISVLVLLLLFAVFGLVMSILIYLNDKKRGGLLSLVESDKRIEEMRNAIIKPRQ